MKFIKAIFLCSLIITIHAHAKQSKKLKFEDATYEHEIRTVQLYPNDNKNWNVLEPPVTKLGSMNLILEFDDLVQEPEDYKAKIIHCNKDWTKSRLSNIDFLYDFNEFVITNDQFSVDTKVPYIHYSMRLPQVKMPGNYLIIVYRGSDESDIILTKRFMVYNNRVSIELTSSLNALNSTNRFKQQLDFKINYKNYEILNPLETVSVVIRQNERWDNAVTNLKPSFIRDHITELEYRFFNFENSFEAGNEYRFFDMRSLRNPGQGVQNVDWNQYPISVTLMPDAPRIYQAYSHLPDINGDYYIVNVDSGNGDTYSDYVYTRFYLKPDRAIGENIYVVGKMNNWAKNEESRMKFEPKSQMYSTELLLKQGWYDYKYVVSSDTTDLNYLEGNHFQTENSYEIFVYHRPPNMRADMLIGYGFYQMNRREN